MSKAKHPRRTASVNSPHGKDILAAELPSFSVTGNLTGMRRLYWGYGDECMPVRVGSYIYNCARRPDLYKLAS